MCLLQLLSCFHVKQACPSSFSPPSSPSPSAPFVPLPTTSTLHTTNRAILANVSQFSPTNTLFRGQTVSRDPNRWSLHYSFPCYSDPVKVRYSWLIRPATANAAQRNRQPKASNCVSCPRN
ncbi:uncharacterized protein UDID_17613 [Ustilago sp. UG-2017a]|nr:uncharacterized protein UDID_17613 [Ustilago sp. UG-2017a]